MAAPRRARIYDRLEGAEELPRAARRFAEVDGVAQSTRPGALQAGEGASLWAAMQRSVVALALECDELLAVRRAQGGAWSLATLSTEWSSRGTSGWHTHACDYAVESLEPHCLFRVMRDGPRIALASLAADGHLLAATSGSDSLFLAACGPGTAWAACGASWEQRDGAICNSRWPEKVLAARLLHITCLPTLQLQRCEEYYGGLLHEMHAEKAAAAKRAADLEEQRDAAILEARRWQHQCEEQEVALENARQLQDRSGCGAGSGGEAAAAASEHSEAAVQQLAVLQQQLEMLAAEGAPELQQERARMSICLQTIKEITDLVRQSVSTTPSSTSSPGQPDGLPMLPGASGLASQGGLSAVAGPAPGPYATETEGESRLRDYLGSRPEQQDPLERLLDPEPPYELESTPQRVLRALENAPPSSLDPESGPPTGPPSSLKAAAPPGRARPGRAAQRPLSESLSLAVEALALGSPHTADGMAQYMATRTSPAVAGLRASQQGGAHKGQQAGGAHSSLRLSRSSFLKRPPAAMEDLWY